MTPKVHLKARKEKSIERKHLWVFSGAVKEIESGINDGDVVHLHANKGRFLGVGHFSEEGKVQVRILSFTEEEINADFYTKRIQQAYALRIKAGLENDQQNIYRLVHAEGDLIPGLIVDVYKSVAVLQCHSFGMYQHRQWIANAIQQHLPHITTIYCKSASALKNEDAIDEYIVGNDQEIIAQEYGVNYKIDWETGQKTGFFIDQRENRKLLGQYSKGKKVLNTYCYSGGFSLAALQNEAELVHSVDSSAAAIDILDENLKLNEFKGQHESFVQDTTAFLKEMETPYDIIVLDPPAFAKHMKNRHNAVQGYKRINGYALRHIQPGGLLFTFSCSQVVDNELFKSTVMAAAIASGRTVRIIHQLHQPQDHPINIFQPESEYLKGLVLEVI